VRGRWFVTVAALSLVVVAEPVLASNTTFKPTMNNFADGMITAKLKNTIQLVPTINSQGQQVYVPDPRAAATATRFSARMGQFGVSPDGRPGRLWG
jgi:hypothetical protein